MIRPRRPSPPPYSPSPVFYTDPGRAGLEQEIEALRAGLAEVLGKFQPQPDAVLGYYYTAEMMPATRERLLKIAATKGEE